MTPIPVYCSERLIGALKVHPAGWPALKPFYELSRAMQPGDRSPRPKARAYVVGLGGGRYGLQVADEASLIGVPGFELLRAKIHADEGTLGMRVSPVYKRNS
jgi:hypothetical protein